MNVFRPPLKSDPVREKFAQARRELSAALIEREEEVDLALTALLAGEHLLLVGPPGCGKSLLLDSVLSWTGGTKFTILLTKFTTVEELMGPVSLAGLKADKYVRVTTGKLPEADFGFIDECFKGSSAILNVMLKILNERTFDAGDGVVRTVPLKLCLAASNEWPSPDTGKELSALFDRFLLRRAVTPIRSRAVARACCGPRTTCRSSRRTSRRANSTEPDGRLRRCRGRPRRRTRWRRSWRNSRARACGPATGASSRPSAWSARSRSCAAPTASNRSTSKWRNIVCGTTRVSNPRRRRR